MMNPTEFRTGVIRPIECMKEGWELIKDQYGLFLGVTIVGMLVAGFIPFGLGVGAMFCGIYYVMFRKMNRQPVEFGDLFKNFGSYFVPGLIVTLVVIVPTLISVFVFYGSMMAFFFAAIEPNGGINEGVLYGMFAAVFVEAVLFSLIIGSVHALIMFAYPLIVERNLSGSEALKLSIKAVWANLSGVVGLILVEFAMGIVGYLFFIVGVYLMLPIMFAGVLVAYRRVFPATERFITEPPAPNYYQGM